MCLDENQIVGLLEGTIPAEARGAIRTPTWTNARPVGIWSGSLSRAPPATSGLSPIRSRRRPPRPALLGPYHGDRQ